MFTVDPNITDLKIRERSIYRALFSMNIHEIATPELTVEDARCYILFFKEGAAFTAYIALYFPRSDRRFYYSYDANPFREEALAEIEGEARGFAEEMGFVLDEINVANMSPEERNRWIDQQDIWSQKKPAEMTADSTPASAEESPSEFSQTAQQAEQPAGPAAASTPAEPDAEQPHTQQQAAPQPKKKPAEAPRPAPSLPKTTAVESAPPLGKKRGVNSIGQAVRADIAKQPKQELKKAIRDSNNVVSRDKEALARLLASF